MTGDHHMVSVGSEMVMAVGGLVIIGEALLIFDNRLVFLALNCVVQAIVVRLIDGDQQGRCLGCQVELVWCPEAEDPAIGLSVAFMRDEALSRRLF
jgi:hypothetical protein